MGQHRQVFPEDQAALDRINEEAEIASAAFNQFRWQQTMLGGEVTSADKQVLRDRLQSLDDELDRLLAAEYGVDLKKASAFDAWRASHQPFHWFVEFYGIMSKGGFDVVIGNPPYVEYSKVKSSYSVRGMTTENCGNLYAMMMERSLTILSNGRFGMIVPVSGACTDSFAPLRSSLALGPVHTIGLNMISLEDGTYRSSIRTNSSCLPVQRGKREHVEPPSPQRNSVRRRAWLRVAGLASEVWLLAHSLYPHEPLVQKRSPQSGVRTPSTRADSAHQYRGGFGGQHDCQGASR